MGSHPRLPCCTWSDTSCRIAGPPCALACFARTAARTLRVLSGLEDDGHHVAAGLSADSKLGSCPVVNRQPFNERYQRAMHCFERLLQGLALLKSACRWPWHPRKLFLFLFLGHGSLPDPASSLNPHIPRTIPQRLKIVLEIGDRFTVGEENQA